MADLIHIRITKELRKRMKELIDEGMFSSQGDIVREAIRSILLKYSKERKNEQEKEGKE